MSEPREYIGTFSNPYRVVRITGTPDTAAYTANDVLFVNASNQAFALPCVTLGRNALADLIGIIVREPAVAGAVIKAGIRFRFSDIGGTDYVPPAANAAYSAPPTATNYLGFIDVVTGAYEEVKVAGVIGYAVARKRLTDTDRLLLQSASDATDVYVTPCVIDTPDYAATPITMTIDFLFQQH